MKKAGHQLPTPSATAAVNAVQAAYDELRALTKAAERSGDEERAFQEIERWKRRSTDRLSGKVPAAELRNVKEPAHAPDWEQDDPLGSVVNGHDSFLAGLLEDTHNHPEDYEAGKLAPKENASPPLSEPKKSKTDLKAPTGRAEPPYPDRVSLHWLVKNVPVSFWMWLVGGLPWSLSLAPSFRALPNSLLGCSRRLGLICPLRFRRRER